MNATLKRIVLFPFDLLYKINPRAELKLMYRIKRGKKLNLDDPQTYLEKLNWIKLYHRDPLMARCADKFLARGYIEEHGFGEYLPKLYWEGTDPEQIPWNKLPEGFVLKVTSGSGGNIVVHNKAELDKEKATKQLAGWLKQRYLPCYGEWLYDIHPPRIIVEELLSDGVNFVPEDYKFFCFNGKTGAVGCIALDLDRYNVHKRHIYDEKWQYLEDVDFGFPKDPSIKTPKPAQFEKMCRIAEALSKPFPHVRVDFFVIGDRFYIGELTFFNGAGYDRITPDSYDVQMGSWIQLPKK